MATPLILDYKPRKQFEPFHERRERFACIVTHRRAGKTVACVQELQRWLEVAHRRAHPETTPSSACAPSALDQHPDRLRVLAHRDEAAGSLRSH